MGGGGGGGGAPAGGGGARGGGAGPPVAAAAAKTRSQRQAVNNRPRADFSAVVSGWCSAVSFSLTTGHRPLATDHCSRGYVMFRIRHGGMALGLAGLLLAQTGCVGPTASLTTAALPAAPAAREDLPKDKAIQTTLSFARNLDKSGNDSAAIDQYEKLLRLCPDHPEALRRLAVLYDRRS